MAGSRTDGPTRSLYRETATTLLHGPTAGAARVVALKAAAKVYECTMYPGLAVDGPVEAWHAYGKYGEDVWLFVHDGRRVDARQAAVALDGAPS